VSDAQAIALARAFAHAADMELATAPRTLSDLARERLVTAARTLRHFADRLAAGAHLELPEPEPVTPAPKPPIGDGWVTVPEAVGEALWRAVDEPVLVEVIGSVRQATWIPRKTGQPLLRWWSSPRTRGGVRQWLVNVHMNEETR